MQSHVINYSQCLCINCDHFKVNAIFFCRLTWLDTTSQLGDSSDTNHENVEEPWCCHVLFGVLEEQPWKNLLKPAWSISQASLPPLPLLGHSTSWGRLLDVGEEPRRRRIKKVSPNKSMKGVDVPCLSLLSGDNLTSKLQIMKAANQKSIIGTLSLCFSQELIKMI